jgi:hypothetical protein
MRIILGAVLIFAAAWLMVRLQAGSGSCCGGSYRGENYDPDHSHNCCEDTNAGSDHKRNDEGGRRKVE